MKRLRILSFFVQLLFTCTLFAQQPSDRLQPGSINIPYLEFLVKTGVDSVRVAHGLSPLRDDSVLFIAATDHAHYLDSLQVLTHFENEFKNKYAPADRVKYHGGTDFTLVGENALFNFAFTPVTDKHDPPGTPPHENDTYGQLSHDMVMSWVHSPPHYKNILTPEYEFTGLAIAYHPDNNCFHAVQVFGTRPYYKADTSGITFLNYQSYVPPQVVSDFNQVSHTPHSRVHAWGLRAPDDSTKTCPYCWNENFSAGSTRTYISNGNIMFETRDADLIKQLIDNRRDGFAVEIVGYKPYDCGNPQYYQKPSRRNGQCIFSGRVLKPDYRSRLKNGFKHKHRHDLKDRFHYASSDAKQVHGFRSKWKIWHDEFEFPFDADSYTINLGKFPKDMDAQYYEMNIIIIQKKQVCRVMHFTSFCGNDWMIAPDFPDTNFVSPDTLAFPVKQRTYSFRIPFEQGKFDYNQKDIQPFLDSLRFTKFKIVGDSIFAFSSVEGSENINSMLRQNRATSISQAMKTAVNDTFPSAILCDDNWALFDKQVKTVPGFSCFKGKTHDEIKTMLQDTALAHKLEPWLSNQRYALVKLKLDVYPLPIPQCDWIAEHVTNWSDSLLKKKDPVFLDSLNRLQHYYSELLKAGVIDSACMAEIKFPADVIFDTLAYNQAWMKCRLLHHADTAKASLFFYNTCVTRVNNNSTSPYLPAVFVMVNDYMRYWHDDQFIDGTDPEIIFKWIDWLKNAGDSSLANTADSLLLEWYYKSVPYYEAKGRKYEVKEIASLASIMRYWENGRMNDSIALRLSDYLIFHKQVDLGLAVLQPWALMPNPDHRVLMQYIRLTYRNIEEDPGFYQYYQFVTWAGTYLTHDEWCSMFVGPCNISFQLFDSEAMRKVYCDKCADWKNYAKDPAKWKSDDGK